VEIVGAAKVVLVLVVAYEENDFGSVFVLSSSTVVCLAGRTLEPPFCEEEVWNHH
jgi:hypothetical protein